MPGIELAGGAYHGIGIGDCLREGAAAADRALEHVRGLPEDAVPAVADVPAGDGSRLTARPSAALAPATPAQRPRCRALRSGRPVIGAPGATPGRTFRLVRPPI